MICKTYYKIGRVRFNKARLCTENYARNGKGERAKSNFFKNSEIISNNIHFQGQYFDGETGLHYNRYHYYSPYLARFISKDPSGLLGGYNIYVYAPNPVGWVDPFGLSPKKGNSQKENNNTTCTIGKMIRVRHYTNRKGSNAIELTQKILAVDNNRVYVEPANKKPLSQIEAEDKYQIKQGKRRDYVEFDVLESRTEWVKNPRYHREELTIKGDVINPCNLVVNRRR
ncbi:TPA: type IV secretion protein Rhs [Acinetobacter baumannii]|nr:type IV secretion protein Rhs [Acinetobacter baumannii]HEM8240949.1 type IV secretion protein Rhs [Acinetobacter baumannii]HEN9575571.1 type IV secretion protein Rhs [Acinetobacter baumannii]